MKCVIFDMDGVIVDSEPLHQECERQIFRNLGVPVTEQQHNLSVGATDADMWTQVDKWYSLPVTVSEAIEMKKDLYMKALKNTDKIKVISYVTELIRELYRNNYLLALASSSPNDQINYIIDRFEFRKYFKTIISGEDLKSGKPDPEIFLKAAELTGVDAGSCLVIEDSNKGVIAAKRANMKCVGYINPNSGNQDLSEADMLVSSFSELSLESINNLLK